MGTERPTPSSDDYFANIFNDDYAGWLSKSTPDGPAQFTIKDLERVFREAREREENWVRDHDLVINPERDAPRLPPPFDEIQIHRSIACPPDQMIIIDTAYFEQEIRNAAEAGLRDFDPFKLPDAGQHVSKITNLGS